MRFSLQPPFVALCALSLRNANITLGHSAGSLAVVMGQGCLAAGACPMGSPSSKVNLVLLTTGLGYFMLQRQTDRHTADINTV